MRVGFVLRAVGFVVLAACAGQGARPPLAARQQLLQPAGHAAPILWMLDDMVRVGPTGRPANHSHEVQLKAADDEIVSFQLVVTSPIGGLTDVRLRASSFRSANNAITKTISAALYR